jgi:hypothetical protein
MDADRFDNLARTLTADHSRRGVLATLVAGTLGLFRLHDAEGRKKGKGKHKKRKHTSPTPPPPCVPQRAGKTCDSDGCGGTCGTCRVGTSCQGGTCICPAGRPPCGAICCTAPTGSPVASIACNTSGGAPACACTYRTADVCAPGCASPSTFTTDCAPFAPTFLAAWCPEAGSTPPPG